MASAVCLGVFPIAVGAMLAIPLSKANIFSRARTHRPRTDSMTVMAEMTWTSHMARRLSFTVVLPFAGLVYTLVSLASMHRFTMRQSKSSSSKKRAQTDDWRPVIVRNPSGNIRRMNLLELGHLNRWTEIRRLNRLLLGESAWKRHSYANLNSMCGSFDVTQHYLSSIQIEDCSVSRLAAVMPCQVYNTNSRLRFSLHSYELS